MDSNELKKRFVNDVTAPTKSAPAMALKQRQTIAVTSAPQEDVDPLLPSAGVDTPTAGAPTVGEKVIAPPSSPNPEPIEQPEAVSAPDTVEPPQVDPLPEAASETAEPEPAEIADKDEVVADNFKTNDALPDKSQLAARDTKGTMQDPKIFDTTAYHVAIKETHHSHGSPKAAFLFGTVFALVVVAGAVYVLSRVGS